MASPTTTDLTAMALPVLARRYDCDLIEAEAILREWSENTCIDVEQVAAWVLWEAPTLESTTAPALVSH
jgi:hypothetical protein